MSIDHPLYYFLLLPLLILPLSPILYSLLPTETKTASAIRNLKLEGLRGLLAPTVFFHHALISYYYYRDHQWVSPSSVFFEKLGSGPVLLFFFMTGFLFWEQTKRPTLNFSNLDFLKKRIRRLFPAYAVSVVIITALAFFYTRNEHLSSMGSTISGIASWITFGLPFGNFLPINDFSETHLINASVAWTLRFEWLFYFSFLFIRKFSTLKKYLLFLVALLIIKRLLGLSYFNQLNPDLFFVHSFIKLINEFAYFMTIGFSFGIITSFLKTAKWQTVFSLPAVSALGIAALFTYLFIDQIKAYSIGGSALLFIFFTSVVLSTTKRHVLHWTGFQALGHISYSVYLLHGIVLFVGFKIISQFFDIPNMPVHLFWILVYGLSILVLISSTISYRYIEYPFMGSAKKS